MITIELLDALLSPVAERRLEAEAYYLNKTSIADRCTALLNVLVEQKSQLPLHVQQFVAVLLRRDILKLTDTAYLKDYLLPRLLQVFVDSAAAAASQSAVVALGHCLAETCSVLSWFSLDQATEGMQSILQAIATTASKADIPSLQLLIGLSERAPKAFCQSNAPQAYLPQLISAVNENLKNNNNQAQQAIVLLTELVVRSAMAVVGQENEENNNDDGINKMVAQLGVDCLGPLVPWVTSLTSDGECISQILQNWILASENAPWLLAGQPELLQAIIQTCLSIATSSTCGSSTACDASDTPISLQSVQVLTTLIGHGSVRRKASAFTDLTMRTTLLEQCTRVCITVALEAESRIDTQDWSTEPASLSEDSYSNDDDEGLALYAVDLIEDLIRAFGSHALAVVLPAVEQLLSTSSSSGTTDNQQQQLVALATMNRCLLASPKAFSPHVNTAFQAGLHYSAAAGNNTRVQYQALWLLGVLCETSSVDFNSESNTAAVGQLWQTLAPAAQSPCSKVAAMACSAMVSFCRPAESSTDEVNAETVIVPYLSDVLAALVNGPLSNTSNDTGSIVVKIRAIGSVACLAEQTKNSFVGFYPSVMPGLLAITTAAAGGSTSSAYELARLRGSAIEAATVIGQALGEENRDLFVPDAQQIMQLAVSALNQANSNSQQQADDDIVAGMPLDKLLSACARIASVMKEAYAPFAGVVLPHLLKKATDPSDVEIAESNDTAVSTKLGEIEMDEDAGTESITLTLPGRGLKKVTINTSKIQEKSVAARGIYEHAVALGAEFGPYCVQCLDSFLPLISFKFSSELRATAAQTVAAVFEAACYSGENTGSMDLPRHYLPLVTQALSKQINDEEASDHEALYALSDALSEVLYSVYQRLEDHGDQLISEYSSGCAAEVVNFCMTAMNSCLNRRAKVTTVLSGADGALTGEDEHDELIRILQSEEELLTPLVDSVGYTLKFLRQDFVPIFEYKVAPILGPYLQMGYDIRGRLSATCLFDDIVEYGGTTAAAKFAPLLAEGAVTGIDDNMNGQDLELKRASIYGIAQISRHCPKNVLLPYEDKIVPPLVSIVSAPKPSEDDGLALGVFENAVSALASLAVFDNSPFKNSSRFIKPEVAVRVFLKNLPLREDPDEAKFCNSALCDLLEKTSVPALNSQCNELYRVIGETLALVDTEGEDLATQETIARFAGLLFRMYKDGDRTCAESAFKALSVDGQAAVQKVMGQYAQYYGNVVTP